MELMGPKVPRESRACKVFRENRAFKVLPGLLVQQALKESRDRWEQRVQLELPDPREYRATSGPQVPLDRRAYKA